MTTRPHILTGDSNNMRYHGNRGARRTNAACRMEGARRPMLGHLVLEQ